MIMSDRRYLVSKRCIDEILTGIRQRRLYHALDSHSNRVIMSARFITKLVLTGRLPRFRPVTVRSLYCPQTAAAAARFEICTGNSFLHDLRIHNMQESSTMCRITILVDMFHTRWSVSR